MGGLQWKRPLKVGDKIQLFGGYDFDPIFLKNPPAEYRYGTVISFIKNDNRTNAVVRLDQAITGEEITGDILVLSLRYVDQTWQEPSPVHIYLCNYLPRDNEQVNGEWVEAAATLRLYK
jgi:hypothetical protein